MEKQNKVRWIRLSLRSVWKHNIAGLFLMIGIASFCCIPSILYTVSQNVLDVIRESKLDIYGEFTDVYYDMSKADNKLELTKEDLHGFLGEFSYTSVGCLYTVYQEMSDQEAVNVGYADDNALRLSRLKILEGKMIPGAGELTATRTALERLGFPAARLGDRILLNNKNYVLTGVIREYGRLWPKGEKQVNAKTGTLDILLAYEDASALALETGMRQRTILLVQNLETGNVVVQSESFFPNTNAIRTMAGYYRYIPSEFLTITVILFALLVYNIQQLVLPRVRKRFSIYTLLGMDRRQRVLCVMLEWFSMTFLGMLLGNICFMPISRLIIKISEVKLATEIPMLINVRFILYLNLFCILLAIGLILLMVVHVITEETSKRKRRYKNREPRKTGLKRLFFWDFLSAPRMLLTVIILIAVTFAFLSYTEHYNNIVQTNAQYIEVDGKMPFNYDFELYTSMMYSDKMEEDDIGIVDYYDTAGASKEDIEALSQFEGVADIRAYRMVNQCLIFNENGLDVYLDHKDGFEDDYYEFSDKLSQEMADLFGYDRDKLISTSIMGYNEDEILDYSGYVTEGEINLEKLNSGEEVILVVPAHVYYEENRPDGLFESTRTPVPYNTEGAVNDTLFQVGDEITVSELAVKNQYIGAVNAEEALANMERIDFKVRIGAIIRYKVGWFENFYERPESYYLMTTNQAFDAFGVYASYDRIRLYADPGADSARLAEAIMDYQTHLPKMVLQNMQNELLTYKAMQLVTDMFCKSTMILVFVSTILCIGVQIFGKAKLNCPQYALLRINGLSVRRLGILAGVQMFALLWMGIIVMFPILDVLLSGGGFTELSAVSNVITVKAMIVLAAYSLVLLVMSIWIMVKQSMRYGMRGDLSESNY